MTTAPKPTTLPLWDTSLANLVVPSAGQVINGWGVGEVPPSSTFNYLDFWNGQWAQWIDALFTNGGNATGTAIGNMDLGATSVSNLNPLAVYRDYLGNIRTVIDHNGYRMGQVTEVEETWAVQPITVEIPLLTGVQPVGTPGTISWSVSSGTVSVTSASGVEVFDAPLGGIVPAGALITSVLCNGTWAGTGSVTMAVTESIVGTDTILVSKTVAVAGTFTTDLMVSPTAGHGPLQLVPPATPFVSGTSIDSYRLEISTSTSGVFKLYSIHVTYVMPPSGWSWTGTTTNLSGSNAGDQITFVDPQSGFNQRGVKLTAIGLSGVQSLSTLQYKPESYWDANLNYLMDCEVRLGTITDGSDHRQFDIGVSTTTQIVSVHTDNTLTTWQLNLNGTLTSLGVTIVANTVYRIRIEIQGATFSGSNPQVRVWINGVVVATVSAAVLALPDTIRPFLRSSTNGTTGGPYDMTIGRLRRVWNHVLAGDNL